MSRVCFGVFDFCINGNLQKWLLGLRELEEREKRIQRICLILDCEDSCDIQKEKLFSSLQALKTRPCLRFEFYLHYKESQEFQTKLAEYGTVYVTKSHPLDLCQRFYGRAFLKSLSRN